MNDRFKIINPRPCISFQKVWAPRDKALEYPSIALVRRQICEQRLSISTHLFNPLKYPILLGIQPSIEEALASISTNKLDEALPRPFKPTMED
jgi:hypothetical protein